MTLRLDDAMAQQLREAAEETGMSQQKMVHQALSEYLAKTAAAQRRRREAWQELMRLGNVRRLKVVPNDSDETPATPEWDLELDQAVPPPAPTPDPIIERGIAEGWIHPAKRPFANPEVLLPSPPGGIMAYLEWDRQDRFER